MLPLSFLPTLEAILNGASAVLLVTGYRFIRRKQVGVHRACMLAAVAASVLFLGSYVTYHALRGTTRFLGQGWIRPLYFVILISHTILAAVIVPLVLVTLSRALRRDFDNHRKIARWTLPIWLYVSVTGVVVYLMLYHMNLAGQ